ncbi:MAG TPA: hypothetical protein PLC81_03750, partial [Bacteroidales bacterium]|nr:hypothetical protein [Bacteroidales bacterium]
NIKSGYIYINATNGDGLDSNGNITISGGTVIVNGPSLQPEVGVDCNGTFKIDGGTVIVSGIYSNMIDIPSSTSSQCSVLIIFSASQTSGKIVHIEDSSGKSLLTFAPVRNYQSVIFSSPSLEKGNSYSVYTGGSATGNVTDGLYRNETYSEGNVYQTFTINSFLTTVGKSSSNPRP